MYRLGEGVEKNVSEAVRLSRIAAGRGEANAQLELGICYRFGEGVQKDEQEAEKWHRRSAEQGNASAQFLLANILYIRTSELPIPSSKGQNGPFEELHIEQSKWAIIAKNQGYEGELFHRMYGFLWDTNSWSHRDLDERVKVTEAFRRAAAFVPRKESTNEWMATNEWSDGANEPISSGTGFFVSEDGYLLTNFHVVEDAMRMEVQSGRKKFQAALVKTDPVNDIALLKISGKFRAIPIDASRTARVGDSVFTVGFPNPQLQGIESKLTDGRINSLSGIHDDARHFQINVAVQPGNSGGALVNSAGNVTGIVTSRLSDLATLKTTGALPQNVNYALKSSYVLPLLESVPELTGKLNKPWSAKERKFEDVVNEAQEAAALILVY